MVDKIKAITCKKCGLPKDLCACAEEPIWLGGPIIYIEEEEDKIRRSKRKTIRKGGKYKERGKEKRREP